MLNRQRTGSVVCASCGYLVGVNDAACYHCGRRNPGLWGFAPAVRRLGHDMGFVAFVTGMSLVLYVLTLLLSGQRIGMEGLNFLAPSGDVLSSFGMSGAVPVFLFHEWWTVFSANWLHGNFLHILLNMLAVRQIAPAIGELYGPGRMVIIYAVGGAFGFVLSSAIFLWFPYIPFFSGSGYTLGASAAIFALLGALVYYGRRTGSSVVHGQAISLAVSMALFGFIMPGIDNTAHLGGFIGGYVLGRLLDPLQQERVKHLLWAIACLAISILSVVASLVYSLIFHRA